MPFFCEVWCSSLSVCFACAVLDSFWYLLAPREEMTWAWKYCLMQCKRVVLGFVKQVAQLRTNMWLAEAYRAKVVPLWWWRERHSVDSAQFVLKHTISSICEVCKLKQNQMLVARARWWKFREACRCKDTRQGCFGLLYCHAWVPSWGRASWMGGVTWSWLSWLENVVGKSFLFRRQAYNRNLEWWWKEGCKFRPLPTLQYSSNASTQLCKVWIWQRDIGRC